MSLCCSRDVRLFSAGPVPAHFSRPSGGIAGTGRSYAVEEAWDAAFTISSVLLAMVFGMALGNLIRGVPLNPDGYFFVPLWTDFQPGSAPGILD